MKLLLLILIAANLLAGKMDYHDVVYDHNLVLKYVKELKRFDFEQQENMRFVFNTCKKFDLAYSCAAITWQESKAGKYMINPITGDYGLMGINLKYYMKAENIKSSYYKDIEIASKLIKHDALNLYIAIRYLKFWNDQHNGNWIKTWGSYNGGYKINYKYANKIYHKVQAIKWFIQHENDRTWEIEDDF